MLKTGKGVEEIVKTLMVMAASDWRSGPHLILRSCTFQPNRADKLNIVSSYDSAIERLGIDTTDLRIYVPTKSYTCMFIAAILKIAKNWKQLRLSR